MNENIDLTELLKDCPKGTKFYSRAIGTVTFNCIKSDRICVKNYKGIETAYSKGGKFCYSDEDAEIDLFPSKDQRDWSKWHKPFVKGDILVSEMGNIVLCSHVDENQRVHYHCLLNPYGILKIRDDVGVGYSYACNLANDFQKQKLFDVLKKEGYKWDEEKKELKPLQQFKDGDIVATNDGKYIAIIENNGGKYYVCCHPNVNYFNIDGSGWFDRLATEEEKATLFQAIKDKGYKWDPETNTLNKVIEPKFKVGDVITSKNGISMYKITNVTPEYYSTKVPDHACAGLLPVIDQDNWILVPNKFDPKTLQPFDKVLVSCNDEWFCDFFSHYDDAVVKFNCICTGGCPYDYCIPYNDDTKHLIGKTIEETPEFYRYWEG